MADVKLCCNFVEILYFGGIFKMCTGLANSFAIDKRLGKMNILLGYTNTMVRYYSHPTLGLTYAEWQRIFILTLLVCIAGLCYQLEPWIIDGAKAVIPLLDAADKRAMLALNFTGTPAADSFWYGYSRQANWLPLMAAAVFTIIYMHPGSTRDKIVFTLWVAMMIVLFDQLSSGVIKPLVGRLRPSHDPTICMMLHYVNGYKGGLHGFVSSHAANTVGIVTILCTIYKDRITRTILIAFAAMMCYSRIYLGVHYPGDILGGALLGWGIAYTVTKHFATNMRIYTTRKRPTALLAVFAMTVTALVANAMVQ